MKTSNRAGKNASKTASATQAKTPEQKRNRAGNPKPEVLYKVPRAWMEMWNILPGDCVTLSSKIKPRPGDFVLVDTGFGEHICQFEKKTQSRYHFSTFRINSNNDIPSRHVRSIRVITSMSHLASKHGHGLNLISELVNLLSDFPNRARNWPAPLQAAVREAEIQTITQLQSLLTAIETAQAAAWNLASENRKAHQKAG